MASILRSSKFVRYIVGFTRNVANFNQIREFDNASIQNGQCLCNILTRTLTSETVTHARDQSLERNLRRLDQDVRRSGRISRRDIEDILEELRSTRSASSSQSLLIIRCCGNLVPEEKPEVRTQLVQQIWKTLNKLNVPMDISHYNALLRVYLENEHNFSPVDFLQELEKAGVEPNRVTYQRLIAKYCQQGDIEGATKILEFMREKQLPVNENVFNALIMGHSKAEDMESAKGILAVMQQAGLEPSADTYTTLLCGYARIGDITTIKELIQQCQEKEVSLLDKDILDIIYALAINDHSNHIPELIPHLKKSFGYNQDCINLILKLINKGCDSTAIEMLRTMPPLSENESQTCGGFLISHMVKSNRPVEKIIEIAKLLQDEGLNSKALLIAADTSIKTSNLDTAYPIFKELQQADLPVRSHYFWPLIIAEGRKSGNNGISEVLRKMTSDFNLVIDGETIRDYVIPNLKFQSSDQAIEFLRDSGVSIASSATNLVYHHLVKFDLVKAADVAFRYTAYYSPILLRKPLAVAFLRTKDADSWVTIVRQICDNLKRGETVAQNDEGNDLKLDQSNVAGAAVIDIIQIGRQQRLDNLKATLNALINQGLSISNRSAEKIQELLGDTITPEITTQLQKLTSGELIPIPLIKSTSTKTVSVVPSANQIERLIKVNEAKNENVNGLKRQLISIYCKNKETEKLEELLANLNPDFEMTAGLAAKLIDYYSSIENLEKATEYKEQLNKLEPNFALDDTKCIKYVSLLVKNGKFEEAYSFLKSQSRERKLEEHSFSYTTQCLKLLSGLAEQGNEKELNNLFNILIEKEYIQPTNVLLGPCVKVHLINDNVTKAIEEFERCCTTYRVTPCKNELTCKLIQNEDAVNLQKLTDLSTQIHGEVNSLYDLVFAFVECGRVRQARKILETPGLRNRQQRVDTICERYSQEGQNDPLEGLIEATKDLHHIDRSKIFLHLLTTYIKQDKPENALGLWVRMQEEETNPTDEFLNKLGKFLQSKNVQVPFKLPSESKQTEKIVGEPVDNLKEFRKALRANELQTALNMRKSINPLSITDHSTLIESLIKAERLNEAKREVLNLLDQNGYPIPRVFRFFLNKLALAGDVDTLKVIGEKLKPELKKVLSFDNRVCHANIVAGKSEEMLKSMENSIDNLDKNQISEIAETFPRGGAMGVLDAHPELVPKFEEIAKKYAAHGIIAPVNVLWIKYFISNNDQDASRIWNQYLKDSPRIMFQRVVQYARDNNDDQIARKLIQTLRSAKVTEGAFGNAYSSLIDILIAKEKYDEALTELTHALNDTCLENINRTALQRLKENLEKVGKKFPYEIPVKNSKSSSSSSDDEKKKR